MLGLTEPHTFELPDQSLATVMTSGNDQRTATEAVAALYASVNKLRETHSFDLEPLRVRWPLDTGTSQDRAAMWGLPVPAGIRELPQMDSNYVVRVETWEYGTVAEILHEGSRAEEATAIKRLNAYVQEQRFEVLGPWEEEYLTPRDAPVPKTLIRERVRC